MPAAVTTTDLMPKKSATPAPNAKPSGLKCLQANKATSIATVMNVVVSQSPFFILQKFKN
jgi:hypothetical protein